MVALVFNVFNQVQVWAAQTSMAPLVPLLVRASQRRFPFIYKKVPSCTLTHLLTLPCFIIPPCFILQLYFIVPLCFATLMFFIIRSCFTTILCFIVLCHSSMIHCSIVFRHFFVLHYVHVPMCLVAPWCFTTFLCFVVP